MMRIRPINDKIVVKRSTDTDKGGVLIPEHYRKKKCQGEVLAVGEGRLLPSGARVPISAGVGDVVFFQPGIGTEITVDGEQYLIISEGDLLCAIDPNECGA